MSTTYRLDRGDAYRAVEGVWTDEGAAITGTAPAQRGTEFRLHAGATYDGAVEVTTYDAAGDAKFRAECERQGIEYRPDWT